MPSASKCVCVCCVFCLICHTTLAASVAANSFYVCLYVRQNKMNKFFILSRFGPLAHHFLVCLLALHNSFVLFCLFIIETHYVHEVRGTHTDTNTYIIHIEKLQQQVKSNGCVGCQTHKS